MLAGAIHHTTGSCPACGTPVPLRHSLGRERGRDRLADVYACPSCGPIAYATIGLAG